MKTLESLNKGERFEGSDNGVDGIYIFLSWVPDTDKLICNVITPDGKTVEYSGKMIPVEDDTIKP